MIRKIVLRIISVLAELNLIFIPIFEVWNIRGVIYALAITIPAFLLFVSTFAKSYKPRWGISAIGMAAAAGLLICMAVSEGIKYLFAFINGSMAIGAWSALICFTLAFLISFISAGKENCDKKNRTASNRNRRRTKWILTGICVLLTAGGAAYMFLPDLPQKETTDYSSVEDMYTLHEGDISYDENTETYYINSIILVFCEPETSDEQKKELADELNGTIEGCIDTIDQIQIRVEKCGYEELRRLCEQLKEKDYVIEAMIDIAVPMETTEYIPNDPYVSWYNKLWTNNEWNVDKPEGNNWWAEAVDAPGVWEYKDKMQTVHVGVIDKGFATEHDDVKYTIINPLLNNSEDHGTRVAGIIGATMDNHKGIAGIAPNAKLFCYDWELPEFMQNVLNDYCDGWGVFSYIMYGVTSCITKDEAKVVNCSFAIEAELSDDRIEEYGYKTSVYMATLLDHGYDFVVVQAAGNGKKAENGDTGRMGMDTLNSGYFACITEENCFTLDGKVDAQEILDRVIITAAAGIPDENGEYTLTSFSNYGDQVSIAAPGEEICSTSTSLMGYEELRDGTSYAAPIVSGAAAAVWGLAPDLTGDQIKDILCKSSDKTVRANPDTDDDPDEIYPLLNVKRAAEYTLNIDWVDTVNNAYDEYKLAAERTTRTGNWEETMEMTADIEQGDVSSGEAGDYTSESFIKITGYDPENAYSIRVTGHGNFDTEWISKSWEMEAVDGGVLRRYTAPQGLSPDSRLKQEFFDFSNITEDMLASASTVVGDKIKFTIKGESAWKIDLTAAEQLSDNGILDYINDEDVEVTVILDEDTKAISTMKFRFSAYLHHENQNKKTEFDIKYKFSLSEEDEQKILNSRSEESEHDIVLVLDKSSSMSGEPLKETKKAAVKFVSAILDQEANIGIVAYEEEAETVSDFTKDESLLEGNIEDISATGGTNIEDGLKKANRMLQDSQAEKKIIVLMSDGEPNRGETGQELIDYADQIKENDVTIYTLGFFSELSEEGRQNAQGLLEEIASEGYHYEVDDADNLLFFFTDIADQINGQKYIYIRIACPVDVMVTFNGETLTSDMNEPNTRTSFGTMTFEENPDVISDENVQYEESIENSSEVGLGSILGLQFQTYLQNSEKENVNADDRVKVLRLKDDKAYGIELRGNGNGTMDYTIGFMDDQEEYSDFRKFENISITEETAVDTVAESKATTVLNVDVDGDGKYDMKYRAKANETGRIVNYTYIYYLTAVVLVLLTVMIIIISVKRKRKTVR